MRALRNLVAAAALLASTPALTQQSVPYFPQTINSGTIVGRLSSGPGPTEAIPFASLLSAMFPSGSAAFSFNVSQAVFQGSVSGAVTVKAQAATNTWAFFWPTTVGAVGSCLVETNVTGANATTSWSPCALLGSNNTFTGVNTFNGNVAQNGLFNAAGTFQWHGNTQTFPASGTLVGATDNQTLTNKHIDASQIDSGTLSSARLPLGFFPLTSSSKTANYTIATGDCGATVQAGTGTTGQFTVTLPAVGGFDPNCEVVVHNGDTARGKILSGFPSSMLSSGMLWPKQSVRVKITNGAWVVTSDPGRYLLPGSPQFFVSNTAGSDANDGLANGSGNALASISKCISNIYRFFDLRGTQPICLINPGTPYAESVFVDNAPVGGLVVQLSCVGSAFTLRPTPGNSYALFITTGAAVITSCATIDCVGGATNCTPVFSHQANVTEFKTGVTIGQPNGTGNWLYCDGNALVNIDGGLTVTGGSGSQDMFNLGPLCRLALSNQVTHTATPLIRSYFYLSQGAQVTINGNVTYSGAATVTQAAYMGINTGIANYGPTIPGPTINNPGANGKYCTSAC